QRSTLAQWVEFEKGSADEKWTARRSELVQRLFGHLQAQAPGDLRGRFWGTVRSPRQLMLLCAEAVASEGENWARYQDNSRYNLLDWQNWAASEGEAQKQWMQERVDILQQLYATCAEALEE
ncbi:unnamed protein product, partial [Symbiodinium pilosum]